MEMARARTGTSNLLLLLTALIMMGARPLIAQSGETIRHHRVAVESAGSVQLSQAEAEIQKNHYAAAADLLNKIVATDTKNYVAWFDLGFVNNALGRNEDAIAAYRQSVAANPNIFESNLNLGLMLARDGKPEAEEFLRAATKLQPSAHADEAKERAWLSLGHVLETTRPEEALDAFQQAAKLAPTDVEPHLSAGPLLEQQKRIPEAEQEYKQVLALQPQNGDALTGLANLYMRAHRFQEAEESLRKLLALRPGDVQIHLQLGRVLAADGKTEDAIAELLTAQKGVPDDAVLDREIADLLMKEKKYGDAETEYRKLSSAHPNEAELHASLGRALLYQKKYADAQQELLEAVHLKPDFGEVYGDLAMVADQNQNYPLVIKALDVRAKFLPELPFTYFLRATAYDHLHDVKDAAENYHRFLEVAKGKFPDQEWQAQHRLIAIEPKR